MFFSALYLFQFRIMPKVFFFFFSSYHAAISLGHVRDKIFLIFVIKGLAVYTVFGKNPDPFMFNYSLCPITGICINKSCLSTFFFQFYQKKLWQKYCKSPRNGAPHVHIVEMRTLGLTYLFELACIIKKIHIRPISCQIQN